MKTRTNILSKAGVLLVAIFMVLTAIPAVTADTSDAKSVAGESELSSAKAPSVIEKGTILGKMALDNSESLGLGQDDWISYNDGNTENALGLTNGGLITMAIELTSVELAGFYGDQITDIRFSAGSDGQGPVLATPYQIWIDTTQPAVPDLYDGTVTYYKDDTTDGVNVWQEVALDTVFDIPASGSVFVGVNYDHITGEYPCGIDETTTDPPRGALLTYEGSTWTDLFTAGFPGVWGLDVGVSGGITPGEDCIPDACDFAIDGFSDEFDAMSVGVDLDNDGQVDYYAWNDFPKDIEIEITNKGEIGIGEVKLLADIYEKICGPTITIFNDPKYDVTEFEADYPVDDFNGWKVTDDGDLDSWVLQGGADNRWDTNNQAWRCTAGEDRSFGVDEDVYLGKSDLAPVGVYDNLTTPKFDISGAACAELSFTHWTEGEYTTDSQGYIVPADYGTIAYSLDDGATWTHIPKSDFLAYDNDWTEINLKFINTAIDDGDADYMHPYNMVCGDCQPDENDIVLKENLTGAELRMKFIWEKDPCLQFEGWYIDNLKVERTEDYELELAHQTHQILEMDPCDAEEGVVWEDFEFPIPFDPEKDTWYEIHIVAQVFDPNGCEADISNNEFKFQFKIESIHDMACVDFEATGPTTTSPGQSIPVNVTVENKGTFGEDNVPVVLKVSDLVKNTIVDDDFETDSLGSYSQYYFNFPEGPTLIPWRWTKGDSSIDNIYENEPNQARSLNPGNEALIGAAKGSMPTLLEDTVSAIVAQDPVVLDKNKNGMQDNGDPIAASMEFYAKWSMEVEEYFYYYSGPVPQSVGSWATVAILVNEGPAAGYIFFVDFGIGGDADGYENDWQHVEFDLFDLIQDTVSSYDYDFIPSVNLGFFIYAEGQISEANMNYMPDSPDGGCANALNPVPWTGLMIDRWDINVIEAGDEVEEVATAYTGQLLPGEQETLQMSWTSELCAHALQAEVQLDTDINPANDQCSGIETLTYDFRDVGDSYTEDMTQTDADAIWDVCYNRLVADDHFAWAGKETEQSAQYINNMDDNLVSPVFDIADYKDFGVVVNFTTWHDFAANDFGEFQLKEGSNWVTKKKFEHSSDGAFKDVSIYLPENVLGSTLQFRFRMFSDGQNVAEGWYVDDIQIINITGFPPSFADNWLTYNDGYTDNALAWNDDSAWTSAIELSDPELAGFRSYDLTDVRVSCGCDEYGFYAEDYEIFFATGSLPDVSTLSPIASGTTSGTGWDTIPVIPQAMPASGSAFVIVQWLPGYSGFPAGFDTDNTDTRGQHMLDIGTTNTWTTVGALGYPSVWGIDAGLSEGAPDDLIYGDPIPAFPWSEVYTETWERGFIEPWSSSVSVAGDYWTSNPIVIDGAEYACEGYGTFGPGLMDAIAFELDLTGIQSGYVEFLAEMNYSFVNEEAFIQFSPDWNPDEPMDSATWTTYWAQDGGSSDGWKSLDELLDEDGNPDDRFMIDEYVGSVVHVRFLLTTEGNGAGVGLGWGLRDLQLVVKPEGDIDDDDDVAPVTTACFEPETAQVILIAVDLPEGKGVGVDATYYSIDGGEWQEGTLINLDEGTTTIEFYSVDKNGNEETPKTATYTVDTQPPTVEIIEPTGGIYLLGNKVIDFGSTFAIGKLPIEAEATDEIGVAGVVFTLSNGDSGSDFDGSDGYTYTFRGMHFGGLTIEAVAYDTSGLASNVDSVDATVFSLGLL
jgi:hypothetical protein